ncbi:MAG: adenylate/guanylate cyclase domain-containing protein [Calditrichaeota bacterium]|nr:adenylate/guanylate cyclase domain-containing protein [Calditrichota bacterium]
MASDRKLAAIMFTDIVGFSRMMSTNEDLALTIVERNRTLMKPVVESHHGTWLKELGDGTLCSFSSAVEAVNCAIAIQQKMGSEHDFNVRIGIHLGDVVFSDNDVYGDGVNVAARIEPLAKAGSICISGQVYDAIRSRPDIDAVSLGDQELKNIGRPITVYALNASGLPEVSMAGKPVKKPTDKVTQKTSAVNIEAAKKRPVNKAIIAVLIIIITATVNFIVFQDSDQKQVEHIKIAYNLDFSDWTDRNFDELSTQLKIMQSRGLLRIYPNSFSYYDSAYIYLIFAFDKENLLKRVIIDTNGDYINYADNQKTDFNKSQWETVIYVRCEKEDSQ